MLFLVHLHKISDGLGGFADTETDVTVTLISSLQAVSSWLVMRPGMFVSSADFRMVFEVCRHPCKVSVFRVSVGLPILSAWAKAQS